MLFVLTWILLTVIVGLIGKTKGRGAAGFFISLFLSPLIGILAVIALPAAVPQSSYSVCRRCRMPIEREALECEHCGYVGPGYKRCHNCAEIVRADALICRYCRSPFDLEEDARIREELELSVETAEEQRQQQLNESNANGIKAVAILITITVAIVVLGILILEVIG